jgi:peptide/nickel transport system substrate-binding protein
MGFTDGSTDPGAGLTRRSVMRGAAGIAVAGGLGSILAACGGASSSAAGGGGSTGAGASVSGTEPTGAPQRGGTLRFGSQGLSSTDTLEGQNPVTNADFSRLFQLYSPLARLDKNFGIEMDLAEEITPNKDATAWTIRTRKGVTFHDGKDFGAKDVLFSFNRMRAEEFSGNAIMAPLDLKAAKIKDEHTIEIPCTQPFANFVEAMVSSPYFMMVPENYDPKNPVGTGPFKYKSFTPGQQSEFVRFPDYYEKGLPYLDAVVTQDFADEQSQINALLGDSIDLTNLLSGQSINTLEGSGASVVVSTGGTFNVFTMRVDQSPFDDVRVRTAMKLLVDREQMNQVVFAGKGIVGNDICGYGDPAYNSGLPQREQDIEQAKSLLSAAGHGSGLSVQLITTNLSQGMTAQAQVLAQQASAAGVNVQLRELTLTNFFNDYLNYTFSQDYNYAGYVLGEAPLLLLGTAPYNETHWNDAKYNKLYKEATATTDKTRQTEIIHELQQVEYSESGWILPVFAPLIDAHSGKVGGVPALTKAQFPCANYGFRSMWLGS